MTEPGNTNELNPRDIRVRRSLLGATLLALFGRTGAVIGGIWIAFTALTAAFAPLLANSRPLIWKANDPGGFGEGWQFPAFAFFTPQDVWFLVGILMAMGCAACYRAGGRLFWVWLAVMSAVVVGSMVFYLGEFHSEATRKAADAGAWSMAWWWLKWSVGGLVVAGCFVLSILKLMSYRRGMIAAVAMSAAALVLLLAVPPLQIKPPRIDAPGYASYRAALEEGKAESALFALIPYSPNDNLPDRTIVDVDQARVGVNGRYKSPGAHPVTRDIANEMKKQAEDVYGIRLYSLVDAEGEPIPIPERREDAHAAAALLWDAYHQQQAELRQKMPPVMRDKNLATVEQNRHKVEALLVSFDKLEAETRLHAMGTTASGNDLASRMVHGSRIALYIGFISTGIAVVIGVIVGGLLGYFAGWVDMIGLRLVEIFAAIPVIMLLIMIVAFYGRSLILMMVVIGLTGWIGYAYFVRAEFLKLRKMDYVMAARASGTPLYLILFKHMLPNGVAPVLVAASFGVASGIMTEATLSFIGLGLEPTEASWGQMLDEARGSGSFSWWLAIYPGMAIFLTVFAYNLIGEALRDVIDPRAVK